MQHLVQQLANLFFGFTVYGFLIIPLYWVLVTYLTPKDWLKKHFCEPHFTSGELIIYSRFPMKLMRSAIFAWLLRSQRLARKRGLDELYESTPHFLKLAFDGLLLSMLMIFANFFLVAPALAVAILLRDSAT